MPRPLEGKRALVTGASSGIGKAIAVELAQRGAHLILCARRTDRLEALAEELRPAHGIEVDVVALDLIAPTAPRELFEAATRDGRGVDLLINNAGFGVYQAFEEVPWETHARVIQLNLVALTWLCHLFVPHMKARNADCHIMNVASIAAFQPTPYYTTYGPTKSFVRDFTEALDYELRDTRVRAICVCPGGTHSEFSDVAGIELKKHHEAAMMSSEQCAAIAVDAMLRKRRLVVTGFINKLACWLLRFVPRRWMPTLAHKTLGDPPVAKK